MRKSIVFVMVSAFVLWFTPVVLAEQVAQPQNLEQRKTKILENIDARMKLLQEQKSCVTAAKTPEDLKKCRQAAKEERQEVKKQKQEKK